MSLPDVLRGLFTKPYRQTHAAEAKGRPDGRSLRAASLLAGQGRDVSNLRGGMRAWASDGLPVIAKGGRPGAVI